MFLCKYTRGALEVLGRDVNVLDGYRHRHHYTPPCLHSLSLRCHSVFTSFFFALPWLYILRRTAHHFFSQCPVTVLYLYSPLSSCICCHLAALLFPTALRLSPRGQFLKVTVSQFSPRCWERTAERVRCSGLFHPSRLRLTVKRGTNVHMLHFQFADASQVILAENSPGLTVGLRNFNFTSQIYLTLTPTGRGDSANQTMDLNPAVKASAYL